MAGASLQFVLARPDNLTNDCLHSVLNDVQTLDSAFPFSSERNKAFSLHSLITNFWGKLVNRLSYLHHRHHPILTHFRMKRTKTLVEVLTRAEERFRLVFRHRHRCFTSAVASSCPSLLVKRHSDNDSLAPTKTEQIDFSIPLAPLRFTKLVKCVARSKSYSR